MKLKLLFNLRSVIGPALVGFRAGSRSNVSPRVIAWVLFAAMPCAHGEDPGPATATAAPGRLAAEATATLPAIQADYGTDGLRINFHGASLDLVLAYLSDAAGFIINKQTEVVGTVEVWSKQAVTKDEAVELLSSALTRSGYAMTRSGRILNIMRADAGKTADTEIVVSADPALVEKSDQIQTQVIPVRYATVSQLVPNLEQLLPASASLTANESANTLILVAKKTDIKRMLKIIEALDNSLASSASVKVLGLRYGNAKDIASIITQLFAPQTSTQAGQATGNGFGGPPRGFGGFQPGNDQSGGAGNSRGVSSGRGSVAGRVTAVADERSNSVVVSAPEDLMTSIRDMVQRLDDPVSDLAELRVFRLRNAEPAELASQLAQLFPEDSNSNNDAGGMPFFVPGPSPAGSAGGSSSSSSDRAKKLGKVLAVADGRTSALIVSVARTLMPQIAGMIEQLDAQEGKREVVSYFELRNADPQDISQNLQDLFNRNIRSENNNQNTFLGRNNPLTQRALQNQQSSSSSSVSSGLGSGQGGTTSRSNAVP
ncbi:MAG TPA: secretin N-terminal domain-containing protein [Verrucomicrobiae bacterium]|nr:secretin N-terminal domain-containing protein [Verrucomicrobiae bacterium]